MATGPAVLGNCQIVVEQLARTGAHLLYPEWTWSSSVPGQRVRTAVTMLSDAALCKECDHASPQKSEIIRRIHRSRTIDSTDQSCIDAKESSAASFSKRQVVRPCLRRKRRLQHIADILRSAGDADQFVDHGRNSRSVRRSL